MIYSSHRKKMAEQRKMPNTQPVLRPAKEKAVNKQGRWKRIGFLWALALLLTSCSPEGSLSSRESGEEQKNLMEEAVLSAEYASKSLPPLPQQKDTPAPQESPEKKPQEEKPQEEKQASPPPQEERTWSSFFGGFEKEHSVPALLPPAPPKKKIKILAPPGHVPSWFQEQFSEKYGVEVVVETYATVQEAADKLVAAKPSYEVALLEDRSIPDLIKKKTLAPLPFLEPSKRGMPIFTGHFFDRINQYAMPYAFTLMGIAYHPESTAGGIKKWKDIFTQEHLKQTDWPQDPSLCQALSKIAGVSLSKETFNEMMKGPVSSKPEPSPPKGKDSKPKQAFPQSKIDPSSPDFFKEVEALAKILQESPVEKETKPEEKLPDFRIQVGSLAFLKKQHQDQPQWRFVLPEEGSLIHLYHIVLLEKAPNAELAEKIAQDLLEAPTLAQIVKENKLGATQQAVLAFLPSSQKKDTMLYPADGMMNRCIFVRTDPGLETSRKASKPSQDKK